MSKKGYVIFRKIFYVKIKITIGTEINTPFLHYPKRNLSNTNTLSDPAQSSKNFPHKILIPYP